MTVAANVEIRATDGKHNPSKISLKKRYSSIYAKTDKAPNLDRSSPALSILMSKSPAESILVKEDENSQIQAMSTLGKFTSRPKNLKTKNKK